MQFQLQIFEYSDQTQVRTVEIDGEIWFIAADVCRALDIDHVGSALRSLDADEKGVHSMHTLGGRQEMAIVSESGLYALVFKSRKATAQEFRKWVTREVIPQIRRTGGYSPTRALPHVFVRRFNDNWARTDRGYFSVISELYVRIFGRFEQLGHILAEKTRDGTEIRPDGSAGRLFSTWLKDNLPARSSDFRMYMHLFPNGLQFEARQYPNDLLPYFIQFLEEDWLPNHAERYLKPRDPAALAFLPKLLAGPDSPPPRQVSLRRPDTRR